MHLYSSPFFLQNSSTTVADSVSVIDIFPRLHGSVPANGEFHHPGPEASLCRVSEGGLSSGYELRPVDTLLFVGAGHRGDRAGG